jgi:hypothetical protein
VSNTRLSSSSNGGLLRSLGQTLRALDDADRKANPHRFIGERDGLGPDFLFVENVARMLGCNVDHVRRIPRHALPASRVGQRLIYDRTDVQSYVRSLRDVGTAPVQQFHSLGLASRVAEQAQPATFDPLAIVRDHLRGDTSAESTERRSPKDRAIPCSTTRERRSHIR